MIHARLPFGYKMKWSEWFSKLNIQSIDLKFRTNRLLKVHFSRRVHDKKVSQNIFAAIFRMQDWKHKMFPVDDPA